MRVYFAVYHVFYWIYKIKRRNSSLLIFHNCASKTASIWIINPIKIRLKMYLLLGNESRHSKLNIHKNTKGVYYKHKYHFKYIKQF